MNRQRMARFTMIAMTPFLLAMGMLGDPPRIEKAPEPDTRLDAVVLDSEGTTTSITYLSYDGELYLPVYRGKALITIPFQQISRIVFGLKEKGRRQVTIHFTDQSQEPFRMDEKVLFVGKLPFGTYQIQAKDLESITFIEPDAGSTLPERPGKEGTRTR
jgi:hypothetical protein